MTIEEMITFIKNATPLGSYPPESQDKIITTLWAGQTLRKCFSLQKHTHGTVAVSANSKVVSACKDYDAVTEGEKV
jgi:hypothetical protein